MHFSAQRIRHYLAHLKPIVSLFAENAQLCTHDVALCRLLSRPSCPPLLRVPYGDALYNLMCARLRITAYALQTASTAGRQNNLRARGGSHTHTHTSVDAFCTCTSLLIISASCHLLKQKFKCIMQSGNLIQVTDVDVYGMGCDIHDA